MKTAILFLLIVFNLFAQEKRVKLFPFKSAVIEYKYEASFKGTHVKYIDDYGYKQADYIEKNLNFGGNSGNSQFETIILIGHKAYTIDMKDTTVAIGRNATYDYYEQNSDRSCVEISEALLRSAKGWKLKGTKEFLGKECKVWKNDKHKLLTWEGLELKSVINFMTMMVEKATKIETNITIPDSVFEIPAGFKYKATDVYQGFSGIKLNFDSTAIDTEEQNESGEKHIKFSFNSGSLGGTNNFVHYLSNGDTVIIKGVNDYNKIDYKILKSQLQFMSKEKIDIYPIPVLMFMTNDGCFGKMQIKRLDKDGYQLRYVLYNGDGSVRKYSTGTNNLLKDDFNITINKNHDKLEITPKKRAKCLFTGINNW